uniref:TOM1-like protein 2 n=1 Tax=Aegilops tauschii subsp. strangulata TaxID=200361 RepID=A0A453FUA2_AEGTS
MYPAGAMVAAAAAPARQAASRVDKATSHLLMGPDWAVNLEICDIINADVWQTKDVVKAVKKRLQHKDPKVQYYALTLLETMMKNCGEYVQFEVAEQHVLQEMVKIIQKKNDMQVRDKILLLLDSWQEAFGGPGGKYRQYHWAYLEVKRTGVVFPRRPIDAPPILTPPAIHNSQNYGSPGYAAGSLNERMSSDVDTLSLGDLNNIRNVTELLNDMVYALNPSDPEAVKDEIITDLVSQCRSNQQKLMQFVSSTGNEQLLKQGLEINDRLQNVLTKYDAIASGTHLAVEAPVRETVESPREDPPAKPSSSPIEQNDASNEEEDEFARLAQRKNKSVISSDETSSSTSTVDLALVPIDLPSSESPPAVASNALVPLDPAPVSSSTQTKEQDMIDLLSLTLCSPTDETSTDSSAQSQNGLQQPPDGQQNPTGVTQYPSTNQPYPVNQGYTPQNSNYVAPWAQTRPGYPVPPWATPSTVNSNPFLSAAYQEQLPSAVSGAPATTYAAPSPSYSAPPASQPMQQYSSVASPTSNGLPMPQAPNGNHQPKDSSAAASKPYYILDNLFSDLIDLKSTSGGNKTGTSLGSSNGGQPMIGGKK